MAIDKIQAMYDEMYKSKYDQLLKEKEQALGGLSGRDTSINNQYTDTKNQIEQGKIDTQNKYNDIYTGLGNQKTETANKYQGMYGDLDNQKKQGEEKYYQDRNQAAVRNSQQTQAVREHMARNNLLQSGESVDAILRGNTDFNNNLGNIYSNEQTFNKGIEDTRGKYKLDEQSAYKQLQDSYNRYKGEETAAYTQYDNNLSSALKERDRLIAELQAERDRINNGWEGNVSALQSEINFNKIKDINAYEEQIRQEQWKAEQEKIAWERQVAEQKRQEAVAQARAYSSGGSSGGYSSSSGGFSSTEVNNNVKAMYDKFNSNLKAGNNVGARDVLNVASQYYQAGLITPQEYHAMSMELGEFEKQKEIQRVSTSRPTTGTGTNAYNYTYVNGQAVPTNKKVVTKGGVSYGNVQKW